MQKTKTVINLNLHMLYAGRCKVGKWWNYKNIVSPFYRILFIISGQAAVFIENRRYELSGGEMEHIYMLHRRHAGKQGYT